MIVEIPVSGIKFSLRDEYATDEIVVREMFEENVYEIHHRNFDDPDSVVIDVGANIGAFSIQAASLGARKVYAIEPESSNLEALKYNIKLNRFSDKITFFDFGLSDFTGTARISNKGGDSSIKDGVAGEVIKIITLDKFFDYNEISKVSVLKIDVEGSEPEVILSTSRENLNKCEYIAIEFDIRTGNRLGSMVQKLSETHHVRTMGSWERGGMIFANRY